MNISKVLKADLNNLKTLKSEEIKVTRKTSVKQYKKQTKEYEENKGEKLDLYI